MQMDATQMNKHKILSNLILGISIIGLTSVIVLTAGQLIYGNVCPRVMTIPACFILLLILIFIVISQLVPFRGGTVVFFAGSGISWLIAIYASYYQAYGLVECPKFIGEVPMCYLSFIMFTVLMFLKGLEMNLSFQNENR